jgi:hypothetical protein
MEIPQQTFERFHSKPNSIIYLLIKYQNPQEFGGPDWWCRTSASLYLESANGTREEISLIRVVSSRNEHLKPAGRIPLHLPRKVAPPQSGNTPASFAVAIGRIVPECPLQDLKRQNQQIPKRISWSPGIGTAGQLPAHIICFAPERTVHER